MSSLWPTKFDGAFLRRIGRVHFLAEQKDEGMESEELAARKEVSETLNRNYGYPPDFRDVTDWIGKLCKS